MQLKFSSLFETYMRNSTLHQPVCKSLTWKENRCLNNNDITTQHMIKTIVHHISCAVIRELKWQVHKAFHCGRKRSSHKITLILHSCATYTQVYYQRTSHLWCIVHSVPHLLSSCNNLHIIYSSEPIPNISSILTIDCVPQDKGQLHLTCRCQTISSNHSAFETFYVRQGKVQGMNNKAFQGGENCYRYMFFA